MLFQFVVALRFVDLVMQLCLLGAPLFQDFLSVDHIRLYRFPGKLDLGKSKVESILGKMTEG